MKSSGKGRMRMGIAAACLVVVAGLVLLLMQRGVPQEVREFGTTVNGPGIKGNFDLFWGCALQGVNMKDLESAEDLIAQIDMRGSAGKTTFGKYIEANCTPKLSDMQTKLDILVAPQEMRPNVDELKTASGSLKSAWSSYIAYLTDSKAEYDEEEARDKIKEVARGWYEFKKAHSGLNKKLREMLE